MVVRCLFDDDDLEMDTVSRNDTRIAPVSTPPNGITESWGTALARRRPFDGVQWAELCHF